MTVTRLQQWAASATAALATAGTAGGAPPDASAAAAAAAAAGMNGLSLGGAAPSVAPGPLFPLLRAAADLLMMPKVVTGRGARSPPWAHPSCRWRPCNRHSIHSAAASTSTALALTATPAPSTLPHSPHLLPSLPLRLLRSSRSCCWTTRCARTWVPR
jgi:hypothetical protein